MNEKKTRLNCFLEDLPQDSLKNLAEKSIALYNERAQKGEIKLVIMTG